jgi:hypothetical protein
MIVKRLDLEDKKTLARWDALALAGKSPYHCSRWARVLADAYGFIPLYLYGECEGEMVSLFPIFLVRGPLGSWEAVSIPHVEAAGVLHAEEFQLYLDYLRGEPRAGKLTILQFGEPLGNLPAQDNEVIFIKELPKQEEGIIPSITSAAGRNNTRQALRRPLETVIGNGEEFWPPFYALYLAKMREFGTPPHGLRFFQALHAAFGEQCAVIALKDPDEGWVAAALVIGLGVNLFCPALLTGAAQLKQKTGFALSYQVMAYGVREGFTSLILGRSEKDSGTYNFKKSLGGIPAPLYRYRLSATPDGYRVLESATMKLKYRKFATVWSRLPAPITDRLGPVLRKWLY